MDGGDDSVGPYIAYKLREKLDKNPLDMDVVDAGVVPENYTGVIKEKKPEHLVIIDAVDMNLEHGNLRLIPPESIGAMHISTHGIPLSVYIQYLKQYISRISLIGIQPERMNGEMSETVRNAADRLIKIIIKDNMFQIKSLET